MYLLLALCKSLCDKRQLMHKTRFCNCFSCILSPEPCIMRSLGLQGTCFRGCRFQKTRRKFPHGTYEVSGSFCTWIPTLQPEIMTKIIQKTIFYVTETRFRRKIIPRQSLHVIFWITNEYVKCNFGEINSRKICLCNWNVILGEINSKYKRLCM